MKWKTIIYTDLIISLIASIILMMRGVFSQNKLTCGILKLTECGFKNWFIQLLIYFVGIFIILIILAAILKSRSKEKGFGSIGKIKLPKIKKEKMPEKLPEFGKDIDLEGIEKEPTKKIKI